VFAPPCLHPTPNFYSSCMLYMLSITNVLNNSLYNIGYFGDIILFFSSLIVFRNSPVFLSFYVLGFVINYLINEFLKFVIQEPRPKPVNSQPLDVPKSPLQILFGLKNSGMPSQHAQSTLYSTIYVFFSIKNKYWIFYFILITIITCVQRVLSRSHTITQVIIGSLLGILVGYIFYKIAFNKLKCL